MQAQRDLRKREAKLKITVETRREHIFVLREELYGSLSFDQLKPHIVLEFFEVFDRLEGEYSAKMRSYKAVGEKYSISQKTVMKLVKEYMSVQVFRKSKRGKHPKTVWALQNEVTRELFVQKVRELRERDTETAKWFLPTQTLLDWVNSELLSEYVKERSNPFDIRSLQLWLHECGFHHEETKKGGVYYDGHERDDVKKRRKEYIESQKQKHRQYVRYDEALLDERSYWESNPQPFWNPRRGATGLEALPILKVSHDESIYRQYSYISKQWCEPARPAILPKGDGRGFHVSDFITTFGPVKKVDGTPVRATMGPIGKGCYWRNDLFLEQVEDAVRGLHKQYPKFRLDFKFDNAPLHKKKPEDAPVLEKMNKYPGGKQTRMRATTWELKGETFRQNLVFKRRRKIDGMYYNKGEPKGLLQIAKERIKQGAVIRDVENLKRDELISELLKFKDFQNIKSKLTELIDSLNVELFKGEPGITAEFLPKYHCELAEIEMLWRNSKYTFRKENDRQWSTIGQRVDKALNQFPTSYYAKLFRHVRAIELAYSDNLNSEELLRLKESNFPALVEKLAKKRKHHRGAAPIQKEKNWTFLTLNEITPRVKLPLLLLE